MCYCDDVLNGIMDVLFICMFLWVKEEGCMLFNMGMVFLVNVGIVFIFFWLERFVVVIFNNVRYMYSFSGFRVFKEKYKLEWCGKYLVYWKNRFFFVIMFFVMWLIGKSKKDFV